VQKQRKRSLEFRSTSLLSCNLSFIVLAIIIPHFLQSSQKNGKIDFERKIDRRTDGWMDNSGTKVSLVTEQSIIRTCCFKRDEFVFWVSAHAACTVVVDERHYSLFTKEIGTHFMNFVLWKSIIMANKKGQFTCSWQFVLF
jgi:hypothetical protein